MLTPFQLTITTIAFGSTLWLGAYLIGREYKNLLLWLSGLSSITFSSLFLFEILGRHAPTIDLALNLQQAQQIMIVVAMFLWLLFLIRFAPNGVAWRTHMAQSRLTMLLFLGGTILLSIGIGFIQFTDSTYLVLHLMAVVLLVMGTAVAQHHARQEGEALWPHYLRSFDYSFFTALLFGGQIALVMRFSTGVDFPMLGLLMATVATAVIVQTFSGRFTSWLDGIAFFYFPNIRKERANLRAGADAAARIDESLELQSLSQDEFARLTRRALSQMGNLPKLAVNPLTQLSLVSQRLNQQGVQMDTLSRATELKQLLTDSITRLKPPSGNGFGNTDEWRHYNALYFPYVVGLRPYRRQVDKNGLDVDSQKALDWFRIEVPPRTLYNWQNAAAHLIAKDLKENARIPSNGH
ncbi:MAG: hypothetical protein GY943_31490 [Chloroflexi bacterium]|nr:hypothetical protein [Chloroflexota bacterium]